MRIKDRKVLSNTWRAYQDETFVIEYQDFLDHVWGSATKEERTCLFSNMKSAEKILEKRKIPGRQIRVLASADGIM